MSSVRTTTPTSNYDYPLPRDLIADQPLRNREDARLMIVDRRRESIAHAHFRDLAFHLEQGDCLVLNETKVILAQLAGYRTRTGGRWQGLYLRHEPESGIIKLLCKTRGRLQPGETVVLQDRDGRDRQRLTMLARMDDGGWAARMDGELTVPQLLEEVGRVPLPHYIRGGNMVDSDVEDYQTVFARQPGSIAAPTAGLHFTTRLLREIIDAGVRVCRITLHAGTGTFRPITADTIEEHTMHAESGEIGEAAIASIEAARSEGRRVCAVGTTSVRLLETVGASGPLRPWSGETQLYIDPRHQFRVVDALITNFHLPRTTLLVLVRSFGGDRLIRRAYEQAIEQRYRFFSYGDAMLIL
jgi:S-adenosylmethionine:tRNA ribosyltransferase-isomerase